MNISIPKVFMSYSWAIEDKVLELSERLVSNGVDVVLDKWDLKEGQDKYVFMEQAVSNPEITRVLILCDTSYVEKANARAGGVGDETVIISPEIYGNVKQEKFIPIIFEKDENNKPYLPAYIKSRIYIDLSNEDNYETQYEKLLRNLHGKPEYSKPKLGNAPEWLNEEEDVSLSTIRDMIKQLKGYNERSSYNVDFLERMAIDAFSQALISYGFPLDKPLDIGLYLKRIDATKPLRDYFLDYIETLISKDLPVGKIVSNFFENLYNNTKKEIQKFNTYNPDNLEFYYYFIWESFICTIVILLHYEKYGEINKILVRTYFLNDRSGDENAFNFDEFHQYFHFIEDICKPKFANPRLHSLAGDIAVKREKKPIITKETLTNADLFLYQMSCAFDYSRKWFPALHVYRSEYKRQAIWTRLQSKKHCEKLFPLFGITSLTELKKMISNCVQDNQFRYSMMSGVAPNILTSIKLEEIGVLN